MSQTARHPQAAGLLAKFLRSPLKTQSCGPRLRRPEGASPSDILPGDVLFRIFRRVCASGPPAAPLLASVCRSWRAIVATNEPLLWERADLSYGFVNVNDDVVRRLCTRGAWEKLRALNIQGCVKLTDASLAVIAVRRRVSEGEASAVRRKFLSR